MGVIGLRFDDFCILYIDEINAIIAAWDERAEGLRRDNWERTRAGGALAVAPYIKAQPLAKLMPLPWDSQVSTTTNSVSKDEALKRLKAVCQKI